MKYGSAEKSALSMNNLLIPWQKERKNMSNGKDSWDAIVELCENNKMPEQWGYDVDASGKKILAKNFVVSNTTIYDFTIYRLERMIDDAWNDAVHDESDAYVLAEILEAYLDISELNVRQPNLEDLVIKITG